MPELDDCFRTFDHAKAPDLWPDIVRREPGPMPPTPLAPRVLAAVVALIVAAAGFAGGVLFLGPIGGSSDRPATVQNGKIAFSGFDGTSWNIYSIEPDGTGLTQLTHVSDQVAEDPVWSPDGTGLAYVVRENGGSGRSDIWVMNADGTDAHALTVGPGSSWAPAWSPAGATIAYTHASPGEADQIWIVGADGSDPAAFTQCDGSECVSDSSPAWSPDGERVAFLRVSGAGAIVPLSIMVWPLDQRGDTRDISIDGATWASDLAWSPDGRVFAFARSFAGGSRSGLFAVDSDGGTPRAITHVPSAQAPAWSLDGQRIAFMANVVGSDRETIDVMDAGGTAVHQIPGLPQYASFPAWQPMQVAATSEPTGPPEPAPGGSRGNGPIYFRVGGAEVGSRIESIEPNGSGRRVVFANDVDVHYDRISFSPDGTRIAFDNFLVDEYGIETANPDGSDLVRLTDGVNDSWASWSPDGTKILFSSTRFDPSIEGCEPGFPHEYRCPTDIYVMDVDGSNIVRLTDDPAGEFMPRWSPDGSLIAFVREGDLGAGTYEAIYTMRPDGTSVRRVSSGDRGSDFWPSWSPDGSQIVFAAIRAEDWGIWVVEAAGSNERLILGGTGAGYVDNPVWSPDGTLIAFVGNLTVDDYSPEDALYVMRPDGTSVTPIAHAPGIGLAGDLAWQPVQAL